MGACFAVLSGAWLSDLELVIGCKSFLRTFILAILGVLVLI